MRYTAVVQGQSIEIELNRKPHGVIEAVIVSGGLNPETGGRRYTLQGKAVEP